MPVSIEEAVTEISQAIVACWIEDCGTTPPPLDLKHLYLLLHQVEVGVYRALTEGTDI